MVRSSTCIWSLDPLSFSVSKQGACFTAVEEDGGDRRLVEIAFTTQSTANKTRSKRPMISIKTKSPTKVFFCYFIAELSIAHLITTWKHCREHLPPSMVTPCEIIIKAVQHSPQQNFSSNQSAMENKWCVGPGSEDIMRSIEDLKWQILKSGS